MDELFEQLGEKIDIIREEGAEHLCFQETAILLLRSSIITNMHTSIRLGDLVYYDNLKYTIFKKTELTNLVVFSYR